MKRFSSILIAAVSLACAPSIIAATRPHYGGALRVGVQTSAQSFEPAPSASAGFRSLTQLVFETLVKLDDRGRAQSLLAASWQPLVELHTSPGILTERVQIWAARELSPTADGAREKFDTQWV